MQSIEQEMKDRDRLIDELKQSLSAKELHFKAISELTAAAGSGGAGGAGSGGAEAAAACEKVGLTAPPATASVEWTRAYIERLEGAERQARQSRIKAEEEEERQKDLKKQLETLTEDANKKQQL